MKLKIKGSDISDKYTVAKNNRRMCYAHKDNKLLL